MRGIALTALTLTACLTPSWSAEPAAGQQGGEGAGGVEAPVAAEAASASSGTSPPVEKTLAKLDELLAQLDARIEQAWSRAEDMLDLADAATDPDEQMRLEEMYGRMAALATGFEEQRLRLRTLRDEVAAASEPAPP